MCILDQLNNVLYYLGDELWHDKNDEKWQEKYDSDTEADRGMQDWK